MNEMLNTFLGGIPDIIAAVIYLIIALIVSSVAKKAVVSGGRKLGLGKLFAKFGSDGAEKQEEAFSLLGKIVYFIVFILFLPGVLERLHIQGVSDPLIAMSTALIGYIPNILAFALILAVGIFIARLVKQILTSLLQKLNIDKLQEKAGIKPGANTVSFSTVLANLVYVLILVVVVIAALEVLNITAISTPALGMLNTIINMIPNVFAAIILITFGVLIARLVGGMLGDLLSSTGVNNLLPKIFNSTDSKLSKVMLSKIIGEVVRYIIILVFVVEGIHVLKLEVLYLAGASIISYLPALLSAIVIFCVGFFLANWLSSLIAKYASGTKFTSELVKYAIILLTVFMTLNQLGVATFIVNTAFIIILGGLAVSATLAFGIGGRNFASKVLDRIDLDKKD